MWRGQWCVRAKPRFFHDAKTEKQLEQRSVFKASVAFAGRVKEVLRTGFCKPALEAHKTECNYFLKINKGCFAMDGEVLLVDYENLRVSEGPVAPVGFGSAEVVDERTLVIPFEKNPEHRRANGDDRVFVALFCAATGEASLSLPVYRRTRRLTVTLPEAWVGEEVHLYGFVQDPAGRTSESVYLGGGMLEELAAVSEEDMTFEIPVDESRAAVSAECRATLPQGAPEETAAEPPTARGQTPGDDG
jgi:hypothetical protein